VVTGLAAWLLWPSGRPPAVNRFEYELPAGEEFRPNGTALVAMSRDGRHFVYNTTRGLYLRSLDTLESRLIPGTEANVLAPFFSPDGESIAYFQDRSLKRISIRGGAPRVISGLQTSSNGNLEEMRGPVSASWEVNDTILICHLDGISRVSANGGTTELLIRSKQGEQLHGSRLLRDGDSVLFTVTTAVGVTRWDQADIVVQSLSSGKRTTIVRGGSDAHYMQSGHLIYAVADALFAVPFDADALRVRGSAVSVLEGVGRPRSPATASGAAFYEVSAEGTLVYARARATGSSSATTGTRWSGSTVKVARSH
jgi:serine/threonine-protein kinase